MEGDAMDQQQAGRDQVREATDRAERDLPPQRVPVNVYESTEALVVLAPLPAVQPSDVQVELRGGRLRFWAHLRSAGPREYLVNEWSYGGYEREIDVPAGFGAGLEARLSNGQLAVRVLRGESIGDVVVHPHDATSA
jgi:HSP20 family molecular chaperone IbpA